MFGRPCGVDGCERFSMKKGLCDTHYRRWRLHGDVMADLPIRKVDGSGSVDSLGYRRLYRPDHPNADRTGCVHEHTVVMSEVLGRSLIKGENVHHKNGNRADNRPENLELWLVRQPKGQRVEDLLQYARWVLETYS